MRNVLTAEQAAAQLGVQLKTVYAYVSRGLLTRKLAPDGRSSLFNTSEVDQLARRGRPRKENRPLGRIDVSLATTITSIAGDKLSYRGVDVQSLLTEPYEVVSELLWTGKLAPLSAFPDCDDKRVDALAKLFPNDSPATQRFAAVASLLSCTNPLRVDLHPAAVTRHARMLVAAFVQSMPFVTPHALRPPKLSSIAARLWPRLSALPATPARIIGLNTALVLLADHELATSTLAARVAASTRASPFSVVLAGLGAMSGPLHGNAALAAHEMLLGARSSGSPEQAVAQRLASGGVVPGFGHPVYRDSDPRAQALERGYQTLAKRADLRLVEAVRKAGSVSAQSEPNIDFALAAFAFHQQMPLGATEAIFALARSAGWIAHALEEYGEQPLRFRARALYLGKSGGRG